MYNPRNKVWEGCYPGECARLRLLTCDSRCRLWGGSSPWETVRHMAPGIWSGMWGHLGDNGHVTPGVGSERVSSLYTVVARP